MVRRAAVGASFLCLLVVCGCRSKESVSADSEFTSFADQFFDSYFAFYPSQGTAAGLHQYDGKLENFSAARMPERVNELRRELQRLEEIRKRPLSSANGIDAAIIDGQIRSEIQEADVLRWWRKNPIPYVSTLGGAVDGLMKRDFAPKADRLRHIVERMGQVRPLLDALQNNVMEPVPEFLALGERIAEGSIGYFQKTVAEWARDAAGSDEGLFAQFQSANRLVTSDLQMLSQGMKGDMQNLPKSGYAIGPEAFSRKLQYEEMVDIPLDRLLAIGEANLQKDYDAFLETAKQVAPRKTPAEAMKVISSDHPSEGNLLPFARGTLDGIRKFIVDKHIITLPSDVRPHVVETPPFMRSGVFAAMDTPGPYEQKATEAYYYVTPVESGWTAQHKEEHLRLFNRPVMDIISIHEAYPGHFTQFLYAKEFPTKTRKLLSASSNAEGWAHYAEQMMLEEGFGNDDPKLKLAQLAEALLRDCRYVVGIKLHTQGMTVEEGAKVFVEKGFQEPANAFEEARRGAYNPTYLYYTLGKLQIYKLREDYKAQKGSSYSLEEFHNEFVKQGAIPLLMIRRILLGGENSGPTL